MSPLRPRRPKHKAESKPVTIPGIDYAADATCEAETDEGDKPCKALAEWAIVYPCCGDRANACTPHKEGSEVYETTIRAAGAVHCGVCGADPWPPVVRYQI
jgi:hypothetical protein